LATRKRRPAIDVTVRVKREEGGIEGWANEKEIAASKFVA